MATVIGTVMGLLLLAWLPSGMTHQDLPFRGNPRSHGTLRCYSAEELSRGQAPPHLLTRSARWEQALPVALVSTLEATGHRRQHERPLAGTQCPVLRPEEVLEADTHQRSISPWKYRIDTDQNRFPQKLAVAECLCRGCINAKTGRETAALNSVQLLQSLLVLRRQPCSQDGASDPTPGSFAFHTEFIRVPVGCTCVLPRSAQ
ncbi:interleukin-17C [Microtus ochrogaster]|uniref:Interleukin-17C n=1 Tax=Microtus ochrogaster TaxID=79684 RepID=A0ABM0KGC5_MICOH|nr:interleukin-17C [Microtus ochrogaster]